jgi:hypothetical protein
MRKRRFRDQKRHVLKYAGKPHPLVPVHHRGPSYRIANNTSIFVAFRGRDHLERQGESRPVLEGPTTAKAWGRSTNIRRAWKPERMGAAEPKPFKQATLLAEREFG